MHNASGGTHFSDVYPLLNSEQRAFQVQHFMAELFRPFELHVEAKLNTFPAVNGYVRACLVYDAFCD